MANKSDHYQHRIVEIPLEPHKLHNFSNESGIEQHITDMVPDEEMLGLRQDLLDELYNIINSGCLTPHQSKVLTLTLAGETQNEIAQKLGCSQSAICKALSGNLDYKNGRRRYGGIIKKLQKLAKSNSRIKLLLDRIAEYKADANSDNE